MRELAQSLPGSLIRDIANEAMDRPGLVALWFGESDLPTDPAIRAHAVGSLAAGETFYSANLGIPALRSAIADYQRAHFAGTASAENVVVTVSGLNAILLTLSALVDPGDEVVVLTPAWPNLAAIPTLLGASVRRVPIELKGSRFALDLDRLADALTAKTRAVILNSPNNPTGWSIPADDLRVLVDVSFRSQCQRIFRVRVSGAGDAGSAFSIGSKTRMRNHSRNSFKLEAMQLPAPSEAEQLRPPTRP